MKRSREEQIMLETLISVGINPNQEIARAVSDGLKQIRKEKYEERQAKKPRARSGRPGA